MLWSIFLLTLLPLLVESYNILAVFPYPGKSHLEVFLPLMKKLAEKKHNVTVLSHYNPKIDLYNFEHISLNGELTLLLNFIQVRKITNVRWERYKGLINVANSGTYGCEAGISLENVQNFIHSNYTFDVIIAEFFNTDCHFGFALKNHIPVIGISSTGILPWTYKRFGNPQNLAYVPHVLFTNSDRMTFLERVENTIISCFYALYYENVVNKNDERLIMKYFGKKLPLLKELPL